MNSLNRNKLLEKLAETQAHIDILEDAGIDYNNFFEYPGLEGIFKEHYRLESLLQDLQVNNAIKVNSSWSNFICETASNE